jgi:transcription initiation factor TFIIIB Brf1 subunit/transcription initiation factor TFIIB
MMANIAELPPDVAKAYALVHEKIAHVERTNRRLVTFYALYHAYMEIRAPQPPEIIARLAGLDKKKIGKAFTVFAESKTGYRPPAFRLKPQHYVAPYFELLHLRASDAPACAHVCKTLAKSCRTLMDEHPPQKICAAVVFQYCKVLPVPAELCSLRRLNEARFSEIVGISLGALKALVKKIAAFLPATVAVDLAADE